MQSGSNEVTEPARTTPVVREVDVLICGGGVSGIGAALGAARTGVKTMVIERNAFLGGAATAVIMNTWNVPFAKMTGVAKEIARTLTDRGAGVSVPRMNSAQRSRARRCASSASVTCCISRAAGRPSSMAARSSPRRASSCAWPFRRAGMLALR